MKRKILFTISLPLLVITILIVGVLSYVAIGEMNYQNQRALALRQSEEVSQTAAASGHDLLVQGRRVKVALIVADQVRRGDSLGVVLRLNKGPDGPSGGLGDERDGELTPTLFVGDCQVTPDKAMSKSTALPLAAFIWEWSVDQCKSTGDKAVVTNLIFERSGPANGSDPLAFRGLNFVRVSDALAIEDVLKILAGVSTALTALSVIVAAFNKKAADPGTVDDSSSS